MWWDGESAALTPSLGRHRVSHDQYTTLYATRKTTSRDAPLPSVLPPPPTRQGHQHVTTQLLWVGSLHHEALWPSSTAPSAGETLLSCHPASSSPVPRAVTRASPKQLYFGPRRYSSVLLTNEDDGDHNEDLRRAARGMARVSTLLIGKRRATGIGSSRGRSVQQSTG